MQATAIRREASLRLALRTSNGAIIKAFGSILNGCDNQGSLVLNGTNVLHQPTVNHGRRRTEAKANAVRAIRRTAAPMEVPEGMWCGNG